MMMDSVKELTLTALLLGTIYYDLRFRIVPNPLVAVSLIVGLVFGAVEGFGSLLHTPAHIFDGQLACLPGIQAGGGWEEVM